MLSIVKLINFVLCFLYFSYEILLKKLSAHSPSFSVLFNNLSENGSCPIPLKPIENLSKNLGDSADNLN
ncbi:MAG: hypothetical protein B6I23_01155 [Rickettsiaceae bacterium 4572_127]|nr:MAG: hypothetical protein B6I23_01155 [Rickettsiaceae bacterium 4572_127]